MQFVLTFVCLPLGTLASWLFFLLVAWSSLTSDLHRPEVTKGAARMATAPEGPHSFPPLAKSEPKTVVRL
jgi:hypothetical protein